MSSKAPTSFKEKEGLASPRSAVSKRGHYHHGDLRAALIATSIELIAQRGIRSFSLAEASRRLGVSVSAPYAHFTDRSAVLVAIAVEGLERFYSYLKPRLSRAPTPEARLAVISRGYVQFAAAHQTLFRAVFEFEALDKDRYPELKAAERPIEDEFFDSLRVMLPQGDERALESLAAAIEATIHGHAMLFFDGRFGHGTRATQRAADSAARSVLALVRARDIFLPSSHPLRPTSSG
jgi:AcrR family transcriptional regulator